MKTRGRPAPHLPMTAPMWSGPRYLHTATIAHGLTSPTPVYFTVGSKTSQSAPSSFVTAQAPGTDTFLVVFADLGAWSASAPRMGSPCSQR